MSDEPPKPPRMKRKEPASARGRRLLKLQSAKNVIDHTLLCELRAFDLAGEWKQDQATSCAQWLSRFTGARLKTAYERLRVAHALADHPLISEAMARGELSYTQVRALTRLGVPELEAELLELARKHSGAALELAVSRVKKRAIVDTIPIEPRSLRATFEELPDTSLLLRAHLRPEQGSTFKKVLEGIKHEEAPNRASTMTDGDALEVMANRAARVLPGEDPRTVTNRFEVMVMVSEEALASDDGSRPPMTRCELADGTQLSVDTVRRIACDSPVRGLLVRKDGTPLDVGRRTSKISSRLRKALIARDRHCTFPGCTSRLGLDAHHIVHWVDGGETKESNLTLLCRRHHTEIHDKHYRLVRTKEGVEFYGPCGLILPRGPSVPAFSLCIPNHLEPETYDRYPGLRAALRQAVDEWVARASGRAA